MGLHSRKGQIIIELLCSLSFALLFCYCVYLQSKTSTDEMRSYRFQKGIQYGKR